MIAETPLQDITREKTILFEWGFVKGTIEFNYWKIHNNRELDPNAIGTFMSRIAVCLGEKARYNLFSNNCHYLGYCLTGKEGDQVFKKLTVKEFGDDSMFKWFPFILARN